MVAVAAVIVRDGRVLACQRSRKDRFPLKWEFPGGKIKKGETPQAALIRELEEELGASATIGAEIHRVRHQYPEMANRIEIIFFAARLDEKPIENRIFEKMAWVAPAELRTLDFLEADRELIDKLASGSIPVS
ncbi:MAG TPA: (deoxy)nucleoside triphosphate pyrophosphohydrolase [Candidatus Acidoferrales bacterium]|nr:(deoxy)nucleoside triphosphate pyrophosphohydrolase [Candidatus Acidoferrales bacterium]